jgi:hypothetical protein
MTSAGQEPVVAVAERTEIVQHGNDSNASA